jgi:thioredoxin-related protein
MELRYLPVKIDIDEQRSLAMTYHIEAVPTFISLDESGKALGRASGYMDAKEMENWLDR